MLGNCEKTMTMNMTTPISSSSTPNEWPQNQILVDDHKSFIASSSANKSIMEKTNHQDPPPPPPPNQPPLKCPRCDSSNTKFCYYNNYSLSQPRHFCKACKRYWTRGGTLRNVPVGGGCRKNKRVKRQPAASNNNTGADGIGISSSSSAAASSHVHQQQQPSQIDLSSPNNPLYYGLPSNPLDPNNFPFSRFGSGRVSSGVDLLSQMNGGLGLGFSSSGLMASEAQNTERFKQIQDHVTSSSSHLLSGAGGGGGGGDMNLNPIFFGSSNNFGSSSSMVSLLASSLQQQKFLSGTTGLKDIQASNNSFSSLMGAYGDHMNMNGENGEMAKEVKREGENRLEYWNHQSQFHNHEQIMNTNTASHHNDNSSSSSLLWNPNNVGAWLDPSNIGSSVPSLI